MAVPAEWIIPDTSALIAYLTNEPEASRIASYRHRFAIPFMALTELCYLIWQRKGEEEAVSRYTLVTKWGCPILWPDEAILLTAARLKAQYALGIADSFIAACAVVYHAPLLTKDPDYHRLQDEVSLISL